MVAVKLAPAKDEKAKELRVAYNVPGYPTMVFTDSEGNEVDRLMGFMTPETLLNEINRIEAGDTFVARLERLDANPGDAVLLEQVVNGLLMRDDLQAAYERLDAFAAIEQELEDDPSQRLLFGALTAEHSALYRVGPRGAGVAFARSPQCRRGGHPAHGACRHWCRRCL